MSLMILNWVKPEPNSMIRNSLSGILVAAAFQLKCTSSSPLLQVLLEGVACNTSGAVDEEEVRQQGPRGSPSHIRCFLTCEELFNFTGWLWPCHYCPAGSPVRSMEPGVGSTHGAPALMLIRALPISDCLPLFHSLFILTLPTPLPPLLPPSLRPSVSLLLPPSFSLSLYHLVSSHLNSSHLVLQGSSAVVSGSPTEKAILEWGVSVSERGAIEWVSTSE